MIPHASTPLAALPAWPPLFAAFSFEAQGLLADTAALASVALIGYLFGRRTQNSPPAPTDPQLVRELARAAQIADTLAQLARQIRRELAGYQYDVAGFRKQLVDAQRTPDAEAWQQLSHDAERLLGPTMRMANEVSAAYENLRKQTDQLMTFAGSRIDQETGVHNRRAMQEQLDLWVSRPETEEGPFALGLFSGTPAANNGQAGSGDSRSIRELAQLVDQCARGTDFVARYSGDELVVLMPQTPLAGAVVFSNRVIGKALEDLERPVWGGVVEMLPDDSPRRLLSRADSALYSARIQEQPCLFEHNGTLIRRPHPVDSAKLPEIGAPIEIPHDQPETSLLGPTDEPPAKGRIAAKEEGALT